MAKIEVDNKDILRNLINGNLKKEKQREILIASFGNPDVFCNNLNEKVGIEIFDAIMKISAELGEKELLANKLKLRAFMDKEINVVNDVIQNKTFDLIKMAYLPYRKAFLNKTCDDENTIKSMTKIENNIGQFLDIDCRILYIYTKLPFDKALEKLNDENSNKKSALKEVKKLVNTGLGITCRVDKRLNKLKDIEVGVFELNQSKTKTR